MPSLQSGLQLSHTHATQGATTMQTTLPFGTTPSGQDAHLYLLESGDGMLVGVSDLGANLVCCHVPDGRGNFPDVTLGHAGAAGYVGDGYNLGAVVGRNANRIAGARFEVAGSSYRLAANNGPNNLHSGPHKWSERLWKVTDADDDAVTFELTSRKGDQGFPGSVQVQVTYRLTADHQLQVIYHAIPSEPTLINLTNHAYWNLNGHAAGSVLDHTLQIFTESYTPLEAQIPTGAVEPVEGTPYDFREPRSIGACLDQLPAGYDDNFLLAGGTRLREAARLVGDQTGITMTVLTDSPALQIYTADYFDVPWAKGGVHYGAFAGIALETQYCPDAIHHKNFAQPVFTPSRPFAHKTVFAFGTSA